VSHTENATKAVGVTSSEGISNCLGFNATGLARTWALPASLPSSSSWCFPCLLCLIALRDHVEKPGCRDYQNHDLYVFTVCVYCGCLAVC